MTDRPKTVLTGRIGKADADAFDLFVRASPFAAYQQSRAWADQAPRRKRHDFLHFLCRERGELIGTAVIRRTRLVGGAWMATVQRGPVVADADRLATVVEALMASLKGAGCTTLVVAPRIDGDARQEAGKTLARCGFRPLPKTEQALHVRTGQIDLRLGLEEIRSRFRQRARRWIRKLEQTGTAVRELREEDLAACQALLDALHRRRRDYDASGQPDAAAQARIVAAEGGALLVAERDGRIVGYHAFVRQGEDAIWLAMATEDDPKAPYSYALVWGAIQAARAQGLAVYDLAGMSGEEDGRDHFKRSFAPDEEELLPAHVAALRPLRHFLFFNARRLYRSWRRRR